MNFGVYHGNYNNTIYGIAQNSCYSGFLGTGALSMDGVDFYWYKWLKFYVILGILRVITTFGLERILGGRNSSLL